MESKVALADTTPTELEEGNPENGVRLERSVGLGTGIAELGPTVIEAGLPNPREDRIEFDDASVGVIVITTVEVIVTVVTPPSASSLELGRTVGEEVVIVGVIAETVAELLTAITGVEEGAENVLETCCRFFNAAMILLARSRLFKRIGPVGVEIETMEKLAVGLLRKMVVTPKEEEGESVTSGYTYPTADEVMAGATMAVAEAVVVDESAESVDSLPASSEQP